MPANEQPWGCSDFHEGSWNPDKRNVPHPSTPDQLAAAAWLNWNNCSCTAVRSTEHWLPGEGMHEKPVGESLFWKTSAFHSCQVIQTIKEISVLFYVDKNKKFAIIYGIYLNDMQITLWNLGGESGTTETAQLFPRMPCIHFKSTYNISFMLNYFPHASLSITSSLCLFAFACSVISKTACALPTSAHMGFSLIVWGVEQQAIWTLMLPNLAHMSPPKYTDITRFI